ncbi:MAG TPA: hypothetical protein VMF51_02520 [Nocardioides sp.]|uniref:hypothetical protein n=1 Tax=Nocardioides sp. TaxID=35761 RepID=UPI002C7A6E81|nr:hypothetical protein [Nocardioides sp.]HTW13971.1 hypothetical protein [Nocardioides sp.]
MTVDSSLFGDDDPTEVPAAAPTEQPGVPDWQVRQLREALDRQGLESMEDRQRLVEEVTGRPVASLRALTSAEARALVEALAARRPAPRSTGSSWDDRDEDTWIDRL